MWKEIYHSMYLFKFKLYIIFYSVKPAFILQGQTLCNLSLSQRFNFRIERIYLKSQVIQECQMIAVKQYTEHGCIKQLWKAKVPP